MAKGKPYTQNGVRHECIAPVTTLDNELGIRALADYKAKARYVIDGEPGGYRAAEHVLKNMQPGDVIKQAMESGVRGKGGAGFPAGLKWSFVPKDHPGPKYLAINADEGEPGTFKDRFIMEDAPHRLIEGAIIACYAFGAHDAYIYTRGEFFETIAFMDTAIKEAYAAGILGDKPFGVDYPINITTHTGAGAYICGEETALLSSVMGERGHPRMKPPFPAVEGLWRKPTIINNVETIAGMPAVFDAGAEWFTSRGTEKSPGIKIVSVSGCVRNPGWWEVEYGTPMDVIINELAGGVLKGRTIKAVIPGGSSTPLVKPEFLSTPLDYESLVVKRPDGPESSLGSAAMMVLDDTVDIIKLERNLCHFYAHESCGKCTPCREGTRWMLQIHERILAGDGRPEDAALLLDIVNGIETKSFCPLGDAAAWPVRSAVERFPEEYLRYCGKDGDSMDCDTEKTMAEAG